MSPHLKGILYAVIGVLVLSPDSLLIRLVETDTWTVVFWRGFLMSAGLSLWLSLRYRGKTLRVFRAIGRTGILATLLFATGTILFVLAIVTTTVANTLIIIGIAPLVAALLSRFVLGEQIRIQTWMAIPVAISGVLIAVSDNIGGGRLTGDLYALCAACCVGAHMTCLRHGRHVDMTPSAVFGSALSAIVVLPLASPLGVTQQDAVYLVILGIGVLALSFAFIVAAPRYLQAPEVNLLMLIEMVVGPYWVWLVLEERPGTRAVLGGCIVLITLAVHSVIGLRKERGEAALSENAVPDGAT